VNTTIVTAIVTEAPEMLVWTKVSVPGFHCWPGAHEARAYLRDRHRHLFTITVWTEVRHDERDTEFHDLQDLIRAWWGPEPMEWGATSCESMARLLHEYLLNLGITAHRIDVSEDGESGSTFTPSTAGDTE
jgi:hypothetical protein